MKGTYVKDPETLKWTRQPGFFSFNLLPFFFFFFNGSATQVPYVCTQG